MSAASRSARTLAAPNPFGSRPGVLHEGTLSKSPPNLSLRRLKEEKRLQPRWFVLTKRSLTYYPDSSAHVAPLGTVPLGAIVLCEPKGGGKHAGKFYLHTISREFSLVAPSADAMAEWPAWARLCPTAMRTALSRRLRRLACVRRRAEVLRDGGDALVCALGVRDKVLAAERARH